MIELVVLMGKGLAGVVALGVVLCVLLALHHLQNLVTRRYPRVDQFGRSLVTVLAAIFCLVVILAIIGVGVETFFWR